MKKFPRFEDPFCLGKQEKARSVKAIAPESLRENITTRGERIQPFDDPNTPKVIISLML